SEGHRGACAVHTHAPGKRPLGKDRWQPSASFPLFETQTGMHRVWQRTQEQRSSAPLLRTRARSQLGLEELESRNLLSVITPYSLAQDLPRGFTGYSPAQILPAYGFNELGLA